MLLIAIAHMMVSILSSHGDGTFPVALRAPLQRSITDRVGGTPDGVPSSHRTVRTGPYTAPHDILNQIIGDIQ
ncbi:MAG: hypothetical protein HOH33_00990 [Verrucomicrobia bacterium]|nr:hypothetical protein [Verrucomicrobiota bacterium]